MCKDLHRRRCLLEVQGLRVTSRGGHTAVQDAIRIAREVNEAAAKIPDSEFLSPW